MEKFWITTIGLIFKGLCQVFIDATVRAENAEAQVQQLQRQMNEMANAIQQPSDSNVSALAGKAGRRPQSVETDAGG